MRQHFGGGRGGISDARGANFVGVQGFCDFGVGRFRAEIGVAHFARGKFSAVIEHGRERRAEANAVVTGGRLDEDAVHDAGGENFAVGFGIERDAAGEAQIAAAGLRDSRARERHHGLLAHVLHGESHVFVARVNFGFGNAAGSEARFDSGDRRGILAEQAMRIHAVRIVVRDDEIAQIDSRLAVRREAHHFPFVAVRSEAEIVRELRVEKAERIRPGNGPDVFEAAVVAAPERSGFPRAAPIENENGGIVESRKRVGADGVGEMMVHETKARLRRPGTSGGNGFRRRAGATCWRNGAWNSAARENPPAACAWRSSSDRARNPARGRDQPWQRKSTCSGRTRGEIQAGANRKRGETSVVLDAAEALFGHRE